MTQFGGSYPVGALPGRSLRTMVLVGVMLLHALGLWALTQLEAGRQLLASLKPILVSVIEQKPPPVPPKPAPQEPKVRREPVPPAQPIALPPPVLAIESASPARIAETPVVKSPPPAVAAAPTPPVAAAAPALAPPPPEPVVPPGFNAAYLNNPPPVYPAMSRRFGEQGRVVLRVVVSTRGDAEKVEINLSSGFARLDQAALDAVQRWKFVPAKRGETAVSAPVLVPIVFKLGE